MGPDALAASAGLAAQRPDLLVGLVEQRGEVAIFPPVEVAIGQCLRFGARNLTLTLAQVAHLVAAQGTARKSALDALLLARLAGIDLAGSGVLGGLRNSRAMVKMTAAAATAVFKVRFMFGSFGIARPVWPATFQRRRSSLRRPVQRGASAKKGQAGRPNGPSVD